ncbi:thermonuclease family protein [Rhizobium sp. NZLR1b]|uniref:thermonuclease family protein n=1 Tax=unclassified Rhizobium TaxID=2613769 RepID=UPI001C83B65F|nr:MULTISPECIES: thermonuclease family protein [unclassified Rhizobium]MBX5174661.1 thermonuclease family protein [Rhizobium sp. NZLR1b]MBX5192632.1 thermonuclease family protein [Rhizobium sp. NZLR3b]MBX5212622.1 thermonuclease family protein [Rhizobium sp. NZLR11]
MFSRILVIALLLLLTAVGASAASNVRVIDGDTIDLDGVRYRLHGIDAPEAGQLCKAADDSDWACGQVALRKLESLVIGRDVTCTPHEKDMYGRWVASCVADGVDINGEMIASGLAWAFRKYSVDYVKAEEIAHAAHVGVWQAATQTPWDFRSHKWDSAVSAAPAGGCPIKGNINSKHEKIYHAPWSKDYAKTKIDVRKGERWFCSEGEAIAAGWRPPQWGK